MIPGIVAIQVLGAIGAATSIGSASGVGAAAGIGLGTEGNAGSATGTGAASGVGRATAALAGAAAGLGAASGIGAAIDAWSPTYARTFSANSGGWNGFTVRQAVNASVLTTSGNFLRITVNASSAEALTVGACYIGEKASTGDAYDFAASPTQITWNSGSASVVVSDGGTAVSDEISFAIDETKDYIISAYFNGGTSSDGTRTVTSVGSNHYHKIANDPTTVNATGYTTQTNISVLISKIEVKP